MFCEKCGTKNAKNAKFCEKCGAAMAGTTPNKPNIGEKIKNIPKKVKIGIVSLVAVVVVLVIVLGVLLNNPVKKVEDNLTKYYENYVEKSKDTEELEEIGKILKSKKGDEKALEEIKKQADKTIDNWVKNFNTSYKSISELDKAYSKLTGVLKKIVDYYNGLEYILSSEKYHEYETSLSILYQSKKNYLTALEYEADNYQRYYYCQRVASSDSYYGEAQEIVNNFVKDSLESLKKKVNEKVTVKDDSTDEEKYKNYLEVIDYLDDNKYSNNLDLSTSEEYKNLYKDYYNKMLESLKKYAESLVANGSVKEAVSAVSKAMDVVPYNTDNYKELSELKKQYEDKLPVSLLTMYKVASKGGVYTTNYSSDVNGEYYDGYIRHRFDGEGSEITYRTNKEYKKFRGTIIIGKDWDKDFKVTVKIYGDDKELYKLENITKDSKIDGKIDLDVSNVDDIRIEFITTSGDDDYWSSYRYIYLVEPYLYK